MSAGLLSSLALRAGARGTLTGAITGLSARCGLAGAALTLQAAPALATLAAPAGGAAAAAAGAGAGQGAVPRGFASSAEPPAYEDFDGILYPPSTARVGAPAPGFTCGAVVDGEIKKVSLSDYRGKYVVLFFYPKDFTFVCPTEIIAFSDRAKEFEALGAQVLAASTDTEECHLAWIKTPRTRGGLGFMQIPILADTTKEISARYGVLIEKLGIALRGLFIISPEGIVQQITINDLPIGRSVDETLRLLQAIQYVKEHGEVCPADWKPGAKTMVADAEASLEYFSGVKDTAEADTFGSKLTPVTSRAHYQQLLAGGGPVVVDFYAPWCGKCRQIGPFLDKLVDAYPGVTFAKVDTTAPELESFAGELGVKALPAFRFFKGGKEVGTPVTGYKKQGLEDAIKKHLL